MHYYVVKQFSHGTPNYHYIWYIFSLKTTFYRDTRDEKRVYLIHYKAKKQAYLKHIK